MSVSRKLRKKLTTFGSPPVENSEEVKSTYVPKPRYHHKRESRRLVKSFDYVTSDLRRLTGFTLILVLVCGLVTRAVFNLSSPPVTEPAINSEVSLPNDSSFNPQNDLESDTQAQQSPSPAETSDASSNLEQTGPRVDSIEQPKRLFVVKPVARSSSTTDETDQIEVPPKKRETATGDRAARSTEYPSGSATSLPSTNVVRADQEEPPAAASAPPPPAKASPRAFANPSRIKSQRPRRVRGRSEQQVPSATEGKNPKPKVIQWP